MMACEVLTPERLSRAQSRQLSAEEKALLAAHLAAPCEGCLEVLAGAQGVRLLEALAGPAAQLTKAEQSEMFAAAFRRQARPARRWAALRTPLALAAVLTLFAAGGWAWLAPPQRDSTTLKGGVAVVEVSLQLFASGPPVRRLDALAQGEAVLFRYRLSAPAHLYLFDPRGELLWSGQGAGEAELAEGGQALALPYQRARTMREVVLLASPAPLSASAARAALSAGCPGCGRDTRALGR